MHPTVGRSSRYLELAGRAQPSPASQASDCFYSCSSPLPPALLLLFSSCSCSCSCSWDWDWDWDWDKAVHMKLQVSLLLVLLLQSNVSSGDYIRKPAVLDKKDYQSRNRERKKFRSCQLEHQ